jgi:hypothetical protein
MKGEGHISTLKNDPKYKNSCGVIFSANTGRGHIWILKNDPNYTFNIFYTILFLGQVAGSYFDIEKLSHIYFEHLWAILSRTRGGGHISTFKNEPSPPTGGHISTLKNDPKYKSFCGILCFAMKGEGAYFNIEIWSHIYIEHLCAIPSWRIQNSEVNNV